MTFRVVSKPSNNHVRCPYRIIDQSTGREIEWINQYLDYETLRRLADATLRTYAHELLHFLRWWEGVHHTDEVTKDALTESTLLDYVRFQSSQERELTGATINQRVAIVDRALRIAFPGAPGQIAPALQSTYWQRAPMGIGKGLGHRGTDAAAGASVARGLGFASGRFAVIGIADPRARQRQQGAIPAAGPGGNGTP
jgi:hypothetical protein